MGKPNTLVPRRCLLTASYVAMDNRFAFFTSWSLLPSHLRESTRLQMCPPTHIQPTPPKRWWRKPLKTFLTSASLVPGNALAMTTARTSEPLLTCVKAATVTSERGGNGCWIGEEPLSLHRAWVWWSTSRSWDPCSKQGAIPKGMASMFEKNYTSNVHVQRRMYFLACNDLLSS